MTTADDLPREIVDSVALALYECEKRRADKTDRVIAAARGVPTVIPSMEPWEECAEIFLGDARAAINAYLDAAYPINVASASADTHPKDGDVKQAPLVSGAVPEGQTPRTIQHPHPPRDDGKANNLPSSDR